MSETTGTHFCYYHPNTPTELRCNKCGKYICVKDAVRTPVGYRCKSCVKEQQDIFYNATPLDYVLTAVITCPIAFIAALIVPRLSIFAIFVGPFIGIIIAEAIRLATSKRRGRYMWIVALVCLIGVTIVPLWSTIEFVLGGGLILVPQESGGILLSVGLEAIYLVLASGTLLARMRFGK
jgi:hypothetical protein